MSNFLLAVKSVFLLFTLIFSSVVGLIPRSALRYYSAEEVSAFTGEAAEAGKNGMIIALGGGFDFEENFSPLIEKCIEHTGKQSPNMLFIPTAAFDEPDGKEEIMDWYARRGCQTDMLLVSRSTAEEAEEKISWADIIYEIGGNLKFLTENWSEKGVFEAVRAAFDRGAVLIGKSSGAMCWARRGWDDTGDSVFRVTDVFPYFGEDAEYFYYDCAGIIPFCIVPHFDNPAWKIYSFEAENAGMPSLCIENGAAVVYENGRYSVITDKDTPQRTAYLFWHERGIFMLDIRTNPDIFTVADGEMRGRK